MSVTDVYRVSAAGEATVYGYLDFNKWQWHGPECVECGVSLLAAARSGVLTVEQGRRAWQDLYGAKPVAAAPAGEGRRPAPSPTSLALERALRAARRPIEPTFGAVAFLA